MSQYVIIISPLCHHYVVIMSPPCQHYVTIDGPRFFINHYVTIVSPHVTIISPHVTMMSLHVTIVSSSCHHYVTIISPAIVGPRFLVSQQQSATLRTPRLGCRWPWRGLDPCSLRPLDWLQPSLDRSVCHHFYWLE